MVIIGFFYITAIVSVPDTTTNTISNYPSSHNDTRGKVCYYCHSLSNNHQDDDGHYDDDENDIYDEEGRENEYEREKA
ncbi:MAG: hypothetical protein B6D35_10940 [Candidatus Brocadia sp. UTAMX2]|nr:MAG: hypothetical protein B6D35_10940 [Candidatus Brocadia sp. UTAMX2]